MISINCSPGKLATSMILDNCLSQLISQATRPTSNSILDLIIFPPNHIENIQIVPGVLDQIAIVNANLKPHIPKKPNKGIPISQIR